MRKGASWIRVSKISLAFLLGPPPQPCPLGTVCLTQVFPKNLLFALGPKNDPMTVTEHHLRSNADLTAASYHSSPSEGNLVETSPALQI